MVQRAREDLLNNGWRVYLQRKKLKQGNKQDENPISEEEEIDNIYYV